MPELIFELGCEELPATAVRRAVRDLSAAIQGALKEAGIEFGETQLFATPRRLIVLIADVSARQPDQQKESRGPSVTAAFDASGAPTKALEGFCRAQGVTPEQLRREGEYVWADRLVVGVPTGEILAQALPKAVRGLSFDKTMRWGTSRMRFARPIRWIVALFGGEIVPFDIEGVAAGNQSCGHRFYSPEFFPVRTGSAFLEDLRTRHVEPCAKRRREMILAGAELAPSGTTVEWSDALIDENVFLTEWPMPLLGTYADAYLELPEPVLQTAMAKHERMFPIRQDSGSLAPRFLWVRNSGEEATVRGGNEWVLNARFNDAKFFFDEDKKHTMADYLARTEAMLYHERLGTVRQRADRLSWLMDALVGGEQALQAGLYAKADLTTGLVAELASLQGVIGGTYARREGFSPAVCDAIGLQYCPPAETEYPQGTGGELARALVGADQLDKLAGYLGVGIVPTGSSDPFGLRRAATFLIDLGLMGALKDLTKGFDAAFAGYEKQGITVDRDAAWAALREIFAGRYQFMLEAPHDVLQAALRGPSLLSPAEFKASLASIEEFAQDAANLEAALRPIRIVNSTLEKGEFQDWVALAEISETDLQSEAGGKLLRVACGAESTTAGLGTLCPLIHAFFEESMIMDERPEVRRARLSLAKGVRDLFARWGDLTQLSG